MISISPAERVIAISRIPPGRESLEAEGWLFLTRRGSWDCSERERLSQATGLYALSPEYGSTAPQAWWRAFASAYLSLGDAAAAVTQIGDPDGHDWCAPARRRSLCETWRRLTKARWRMDVRAEDFIPMINAHFLFRLVSRSAQYAKSHFDELTLAMHGDQLAVDVGGASFKVPAWGSWPSPIAVNSKSFTSAARAVSEDYVLFQYAAGKLEFGGRRLDAREI